MKNTLQTKTVKILNKYTSAFFLTAASISSDIKGKGPVKISENISTLVWRQKLQIRVAPILVAAISYIHTSPTPPLPPTPLLPYKKLYNISSPDPAQ